MRTGIRLKPATDQQPARRIPFAPVTVSGEGGHNPQLCADDACDRLACIAYKAGYRNGYQEGYADGWAEGYQAGYAAGVAAASGR